MENKNDDGLTLLNTAFDLTMMGVFLTIIIAMVEGRITGQHVVIICCYLAVKFMWRIVWPVYRLKRYLGWRLFCVFMVGVFSWCLIYTAENTRAGWYRLNVQQSRIQGFIKPAPVYIVLSNGDGYITATSDNIQLLTGYTPKELIGQQTTVLMRDAPAAKHLIAYEKAVAALRSPHEPQNGWMLQGLVTVAIKRKDGSLSPVRIYAAGVRWSTDIQFKGDIDMFAVIIPIPVSQALEGRTTISPREKSELVEAPLPPSVSTIVPIPSTVPVPSPPAGYQDDRGQIIDK